MIDVENAVYSAIANGLRAKYNGIFITGDDVAAPTQFPCFSLVEADNTTYTRSNDFQKTDHHATIMYTGNAYSNIQPGRKAQARAIMNDADAIMLSLGFVRIMNSPMSNISDSIARRTARWRGVVSEELRVYQS